ALSEESDIRPGVVPRVFINASLDDIFKVNMGNQIYVGHPFPSYDDKGGEISFVVLLPEGFTTVQLPQDKLFPQNVQKIGTWPEHPLTASEIVGMGYGLRFEGGTIKTNLLMRNNRSLIGKTLLRADLSEISTEVKNWKKIIAP